MSNIRVQVSEYKRLKNEIAKVPKQMQKAIDYTIKDFNRSMPGWIADEVIQKYNIGKQKITSQKVGKISKRGSGSEATIIFSGRPLTPIHFGMTPKAPRQSYTLKAEITTGNKVVLGQKKKLTKKQLKNIGKNFRRQGTQNSDHSPIMLMKTGSKSAAGTQYIPFQRRSADRKDIAAIKTVSLPQMMSHDGVTLKPEISNVVWAKLDKQLEKNVERFMNK